MTRDSTPRKPPFERDAPSPRPPKRDKNAQSGRRSHDRAPRPSPAPNAEERFRCIHCGAQVGPTVSGGRHRNHCPVCLSSRHVDATEPGDRASTCRGAMAPIGRFERPNGEPVILHKCARCGFERYNRVAADDDWDRYLALQIIPARHVGASNNSAISDR